MGKNKTSRPGTLFCGKRGGNYPTAKVQTFSIQGSFWRIFLSISANLFVFSRNNPNFAASTRSLTKQIDNERSAVAHRQKAK